MLADGKYCYVLGPRQIGKSSLGMHVAEKLESEEGTCCAFFDISIFWTEHAEEDVRFDDLLWNIADTIGERAGVKRHELDAFWAKSKNQSSALKLKGFLCEIVLDRLADRRLAVFIDEIQVAAAWSLSGSLFAAIRNLYEDRARRPVLERLTFCLIGATGPEGLSREGAPYNIGQRIELDDLSRDQMDVFRSGLAFAGAGVDNLLDAVFDWTRGHPYMTQRICDELGARRDQIARPVDEVDRVVEECFLALAHRSTPTCTRPTSTSR
jgi:hypothetical protein